MAKGFYISKGLAVVTVMLTASAICGIITMMIVYQIELDKFNATARPTFTPTTPFPTGPPPVMRLPEDLVPESYRLFVKIHFYSKIIEEVNVTSPNQTMLFSGNSTVHFTCVKSTKSIFLHSSGLEVDSWNVLDREAKTNVPIGDVKFHSDGSDFLEIQMDEVLEKDRSYSLFLKFQGEMTDLMYGLYASTYNEGVSVNGSSTERLLAVTQMEPTDARRVFPCFDEPAMKAVFNVTIIHRRGLKALGNAVKEGPNILDDEWSYTTFSPTNKMSTYLLAFTVSEFSSTPVKFDRVSITIYARPEAIEAGHATYAASISGNLLKFYEDFFEIQYPITKLDQIAVPDFGGAGMENWGLITYWESALLYDKSVSSLFNKEFIATVVSHELAHQWFGNLVTMKWWNNIWLNEGFAVYMSYLGVDEIEPTWNIKDVFAVKELHNALEWDSLVSSHPLSSPENDIQHPGEILSLFDGITYSKGATVLRMLADLLTDRVFKNGIRAYLNAFKYANTEEKDLWHHLQMADNENMGGNDVAGVMDTWVSQTGFPVIAINTSSGEVYQKQFLFNQTVDSSTTWKVPIKVMSEKSPKPFLVKMYDRTANREDLIAKDGQWILANVNATGYFRVNYDPENWRKLLTQLEKDQTKIPLINRGQLIDDAFNLARAKLVNVTLGLNFTRYLYNETAYIPWESAVRNLNYFVLMFDRSEVYGPMQAYLRKQVEGLYGFFQNYTDNSTVPEDHSMQHNQVIAIEVACSNGLFICKETVERMFNQWKFDENNTRPIHPNLRPVIYCQAVAKGGEEEWEFAWKMYQSSTVAAERDHFQKALSCTNEVWLLNRYLEYTLEPEMIRKMDAVSTIIDIAKNKAGQALAWNFIRAHWKYITEELGGGLKTIYELVEGVTERFSTNYELHELKQFQMEHEEDLGTLDGCIERTEANIQWVQENKKTVLQWFRNEKNKY